jgi:hypothetical protein
MKKILIFSPSYNEKVGGSIVLHKLCSILNELGHEAYLFPAFETFTINKNNFFKNSLRLFKNVLIRTYRGYKTNPTFDTPLFKEKLKGIDWNDWVVVYPEVVFGNPLNAKNVVRWLLHQPGFHSGNVFYGNNELYFKFNSAIDNFVFQQSVLSDSNLKVIHYPLEHYNNDDTASKRSGTAYCLRKGKNKPLVHHSDESILIDQMSHAEVAKVFKKVKTFISYDTLTAYSLFAVLCGCESIVIPDKGVAIDEWYPNIEDRNGIAYGFEDLERANKTKHLVRAYVATEQEKSVHNVKVAIEIINNFFKN